MKNEVEYGSNLVLLIPRDDFAKLMDHVAKIEQASLGALVYGSVLVEYERYEVETLSRIASDLSQQADGQN